MIQHYCGFEAGVRNLRKCLDRVFRKVVSKLEEKKSEQLLAEKERAIEESKNLDDSEKPIELGGDIEEEDLIDPMTNEVAIVQKGPEDIEVSPVIYEINSHNLEKYLDVNMTDDFYYLGINDQLPVGSSNGLAYMNDGYGSVLKI